MSRWRPTGTCSHYGPPKVGSLIAREHAVWRVALVHDLPLSDADREVWLAAGMPDLETWRGRPYKIGIDWVGGLRPAWAPEDRQVPLGFSKVPAVRFGGYEWHTYPDSGRWPVCSCCGEPMPCRAEVRDRAVAAGVKQLDRIAQIQAGSCWGCTEPIGRRQVSVAYGGDNLDLPGGITVRFHTRARCWGAATAYELRWIAVDPRRERILTYPMCAGLLVVHADGSSECREALGLPGYEHQPAPDCGGHETHDHHAMTACYCADEADCPRGCERQGHPGAAPARRPERRCPA